MKAEKKRLSHKTLPIPRRNSSPAKEDKEHKTLSEHIKGFYDTFGDRGVMFLLFAFSVVIHALMSLQMELPAISPDEYGTASVAAFYAGKDWPLMGSLVYYYGYVQAIAYLPLELVFKNPYALYKAMLVMNGVIISFIPMIVYHLASKMGVEKVWQKTVAALCCGFYVTYIAHSKFIWNEAVCSLLPWLLIWCVFMAWGRVEKPSGYTFSIIIGFLCAACYGAHSRLIAVVVALVLTLLIARIVFKKNIVNLPCFFVSLAVSFIAEHFFKKMIKEQVWLGNADLNTVDSGIDRLSGLFEEGGFMNLIATLFGHLYTFCTSTLGFGAIALTVFVILCAKRISEWNANRHNNKRDDDGTTVHTPVKRHYSLKVLMFGIYAFLAVGGSMLLSVLYKFNSSQFGDIKDLVMFGRYTDNVAPMAVFLVLVFIFEYKYNIKTILASAGIYAYICFGFAMTTHPLLDSGSYRESPILGLCPWRFGEDYNKDFTELSFIIMSSVVFAVFALLVVYAACSRAHHPHFTAVTLCIAIAYSTMFVGFDYLPLRAEENLEKTTPIKEVCEYIYNDSASPDIVAYKLNSRNTGLLQFLNPEAIVRKVSKEKNLPESGLMVLENGTEIPFTTSEYDIVGATSEYSIIAYGTAAREYIKFKGTSMGLRDVVLS